MFRNAAENLKKAAADDLGLVGLKTAIIVLALLFIAAALVINNKMTLAAILAWMLLP